MTAANSPKKAVLSSREAFLSRKASTKPHPCVLSDGSVVLMRRMTGKDYREWRSLLRNEDGSLNVQRHAVSEELMLTFAIVDESGQQLLTVSDVMESNVFDQFELGDLNAMKQVVDAFSENRNLDSLGNG